jgi:Tol biopolymer transport system component
MRPIRMLGLTLSALVLTLAGAVPASGSFPGGNGRIAWATARSDEFDIWSMNPNGSGKKRLTTSAREDHSPAWDRGGSFLVFTRNDIGGGPGDLFRMARDGSGVVRLTNTPSISEFDPVWSPEAEVPMSGRRILFSSTRTGNGDLYTIRASDGGDLRRLTTAAKLDFEPDWNANSTGFPHGRIVFVSMRTGNGDLYVMRPDGTDLKRLTFGPAHEREPSWAGFGGRIAFVSDRDGDNEIFTIKADGTGLRQLTHNQADDRSPAWAPQGGSPGPDDRIAFTSDRHKATFEVYTMQADGTSVQRITRDDFVDGPPAWQPLAG